MQAQEVKGKSQVGPVAITDKNYDAEVAKSKLPVLLFFTAYYSGPAKAAKPIIAELATEYAGKLKVGQAEYGDCPDTVTKLKIEAVPMFIFIKDGRVLETIQGMPAEGKEKFRAVLSKSLGVEK